VNLPTSSDLELWAITSVRGLTKEERELAASNLFAAAKAYARALARLEEKNAVRGRLMRAQVAQMTSFAERWEGLDKPALQAVVEKLEQAGREIVQTSGTAPKLSVVKPEGEPTAAKRAFDGAKGRGE
jgi:hypothetical protein